MPQRCLAWACPSLTHEGENSSEKALLNTVREPGRHWVFWGRTLDCLEPHWAMAAVFAEAGVQNLGVCGMCILGTHC